MVFRKPQIGRDDNSTLIEGELYVSSVVSAGALS